MQTTEIIRLVGGVGAILSPFVVLVVVMTLDAIYDWDVMGDGWLKRWKMLKKDPLCWIKPGEKSEKS